MGGERPEGSRIPALGVDVDQSPRQAAATVALVYAFLGVLWILFSDMVAGYVTTSAGQLSTLQTIKGWIFVGASAGLLYWLVLRTHRRVAEVNDDLQTVLHQVSILHRILRHNLRNLCTIIEGSLDRLEDHVDDEGEDPVTVLHRQNDRLIALSRKSQFLRDFLSEEATAPWVHDLASIAETEVAAAREAHPDAHIEVATPEEVPVSAYRYLDEAVEELIENAIEHNDSPTPTVRVRVETDADTASITVEDDGPGIPMIERDVLGQAVETDLAHSTGLGLWLVHLTVEASGGRLTFEDREAGGSRVRIRLPRAAL